MSKLRYVATVEDTKFFDHYSNNFIVSIDPDEGVTRYSTHGSVAHDFTDMGDHLVVWLALDNGAQMLCSIMPNEPGMEVINFIPPYEEPPPVLPDDFLL